MAKVQGPLTVDEINDAEIVVLPVKHNRSPIVRSYQEHAEEKLYPQVQRYYQSLQA